jgi:hypothetical protein
MGYVAGMRRLIVIVVVLAVVLAGVDVLARITAQAAVARQLRTSQHLSQQPKVDITGFPFLLQAARGRYDEVDVQLQQVAAGGELRLDTLTARLRGVHVPLRAVLGSGLQQIPVDAVHVTGSATFATLDATVASAIPADLASVQFADGGAGRLKVTATYRGLGGPLTVSGLARVAVSSGRLTLTVPPESLAQVPAALRSTAAQLLTQTVQLQRLPLGLVANGVSVGPNGITASADATNVVLPAS